MNIMFKVSEDSNKDLKEIIVKLKYFRKGVDNDYVLPFLFIQFEIEDHPDVTCPYDYMKVSAGKNRKLGPLCGKTPPHNITSSGNYMHIEFVSDDSGNYKGFKAFYDTHGMLILE